MTLLPLVPCKFELRHSVSASEQSIYHTQAGFDPPFAEGAEFTELKTDAITNQATTAGLKITLLDVNTKANSTRLKAFFKKWRETTSNWQLTGLAMKPNLN